jgi:Peptidoglycan-synthase activator LpoB
MTSSTSSSSSWLAAALGVALALLAGCAHASHAPPAAIKAKLALFPVENLTGGGAPTGQLLIALETAMRARGIDIVGGDILERFLARHRVRYTGGITSGIAVAARDELGVEGVLLTSVELYSAARPPKLALTIRLVSAADEPKILWVDGASRTGDESPGLLGMGLLGSLEEVQARVLSGLASSLVTFLEGRPGQAGRCQVEGRFKPRIAYRGHLLADAEQRSVAVLPFINESPRRDAGEVLALHFLRQLAASGAFAVVDPGDIRQELVEHRITMEGGVSLDTARVIFETLRSDFVLAGVVREYEDRTSSVGTVKVSFTAVMLDRVRNEIVWSSTSTADSTKGVWFFGAGTVATASALACRMVSTVVDGMIGKSSRGSRDTPAKIAPVVAMAACGAENIQ